MTPKPPSPGALYVEAPPGVAGPGEEIAWDLEEDDEWFRAAVRQTQRKEKALNALAFLFSVKFDEAEWVRNSGRFAKFIGGGDTGDGGAGGPTEEDWTREPVYREEFSDYGGQPGYVRNLAEGVKDTADYKVLEKQYFGSSTSVSINQELRHPTDDSPRHRYYKDMAAETVEAAHGAAVRLPENVVSYRGLTVRDPSNFAEGVEFQDNGLVSTTLNRVWAGRMAQMWTDPQNSGLTPVVLRMRLPKGTRVVPHPAESELVVLPKANFRVTGRSMQGNLNVIEVDLIGEGP